MRLIPVSFPHSDTNVQQEPTPFISHPTPEQGHLWKEPSKQLFDLGMPNG